MSRHSPGDLVSGKYRIVRLIGDGGMGVVYEARHEVLGSSVALKFLHADLARRPGLTERFMQEARVSATIQSPHVTHVTDVDVSQDGSPYLVMELLSGESLQALLDRQGRLPVDQTVDFGLQILAGLEAAHSIGVVHRDMKPDNVFVTPSSGGPLLKIIDFGIAKLRASSEYTKGLTRAGVVMGTPEYMAPEQLVSAHTTDHRADIYSVGVMLFEMLAGCRPADGEDADAIVAAVEAGRVRRLSDVAPGLPPGLVALVERATLPEREQRFESASAMRLALASFAGHLSHAGRLAAGQEPLGLPGAGVPRTVPSDGPPLTMSQLGAARTSLSERAPALLGGSTGTQLRGDVPPYAPPPLYGPAPYPSSYPPPHAAPQPSPPVAPRRRRSGLLFGSLLVLILGAGGAVGYAAYLAADDHRATIPPLPDATSAVTNTPEAVETISPDNQFPSGTNPGVVASPPAAPRSPSSSGSRPPTKEGSSGGGGTSNTGPVVIGAGGTGIQLPFPLPSGIQIPTALPSNIPLPPGISFPSGIPGLPQPTSSPQGPPATPPTAEPTSTPPPTTRPRRVPQSTKP